MAVSSGIGKRKEFAGKKEKNSRTNEHGRGKNGEKGSME